MKGKRLFQLIKELNRTEHRQLVYDCSISSDKRNKALLELLKKRSLSEKSFETWLQGMVKSWGIKDETEQDKKQRRWVDFACKEIENLLLRNYYSQSDKRYHDLSGLFSKRNHQDLTAYYNAKAIESARRNKWYDMLADEYDLSVQWLSRNQNSKNISLIRGIMKMRKEVTDLRYHEAMSYFYTVNSSLFLDLPSQFSDKAIIPNPLEFRQLRKSSPDEYSAILYALAETRYNLYQKPKYEKLLNDCFNLIEKSDLQQRDKELLKRSALYVKITGGIYHGYPIENMSEDAWQMFQYSLKYDIRDTTGFFLLLFFLLIEGNMAAYDEYMKKYKATMFIKGTEDYTAFLAAFKHYREGRYKPAIKLLMDISYSNSHYLSIWSRLLEIAIHYKDGDRHMCNLMVNRAKRTIASGTSPKILHEPVGVFLSTAFSKQIKTKKPLSNLFAYYGYLL